MGSRHFLKWQKPEHACTLLGKIESIRKINHVGAKGTVAAGLIIIMGQEDMDSVPGWMVGLKREHGWLLSRTWREGRTEGGCTGSWGHMAGPVWETGSCGLGLQVRGWREGSGSTAERTD